MKTMLTTTCALLGAGLALALPRSAATPEPALHEGSTIACEGVGRAPLGGPATLHLRARVSAESEVAEEALENFLDARRRAAEAFASLGVEGLEVVGRGLEAEHRAPMEAGNDMGIVMMGMDTGGFEGVRYREELDVRVPGFGARDDDARRALLSRLLDVGLDAGVELVSAPNDPQAAMFVRLTGGEEPSAGKPMASLVADDRGPEDAALAAAFDDAHTRARTLAAHANRTLGPVHELEVTSLSSEPAALTSGGELRAAVKVTWHLR